MSQKTGNAVFGTIKQKKEQENMWVLVTTLSLILKGMKRKDLKCFTRRNIRIRGPDVSAKVYVRS